MASMIFDIDQRLRKLSDELDEEEETILKILQIIKEREGTIKEIVRISSLLGELSIRR